MPAGTVSSTGHLHLFDELGRLDNGSVVRLEFKRGLPCLLETAAAAIDDRPIAPKAPERHDG